MTPTTPRDAALSAIDDEIAKLNDRLRRLHKQRSLAETEPYRLLCVPQGVYFELETETTTYSIRIAD
jgi:hypothetical protein